MSALLNDLRSMLKQAKWEEQLLREAMNKDRVNDDKTWESLKKQLDMARELRYAPECKRVRDRLHEVQAAIDQERIRLAESGQAESPWPVGTVLVRWERERFARNPKLFKTSERVIIDIYKSRDQLVENIRNYAIPQKGDIVAFVLKKDGTPSKRHFFLSKLGWSLWHPEGVDPNVQQEPTNAIAEG